MEKKMTEQRVPLTIPLDPRGETQKIYLCVNGSNMLVQTGETVAVPPAFAEVYENARRQDLAAGRTQEQLEKKG